MSKKAIGKIERLSVEHFKKPGRKLYLVPLLFSGGKSEKKVPKEYLAKVKVYWDEVEDRLDDLKAKVGKIDKIYHELVDIGGEKGLKIIKNLNKRSYQITRKFFQEGGVLEAMENGNLVKESVDWARCLAAGLQSEKALRKISQFYIETVQKREEFITREIDKTLKDNEIGIIFIREDNNIKFPSGIEIFRIYPPILDDIHRYLRDFRPKGE